MKRISSQVIPRLLYVDFKLVVDSEVSEKDIPDLQIKYFPIYNLDDYPIIPECSQYKPESGNHKLTWRTRVPETYIEAMKEVYEVVPSTLSI